MENNNKNLRDYLTIFNEELNIEDRRIICERIGCSKSTLYNYLNPNFEIPDNYVGNTMSEGIKNEGLNILTNRRDKLISQL